MNIIDTPGHVDFTVEVERALRVLDGAVLVLCAVGGVQSQTLTVDRQMRRYDVPRLAFVNKCDRPGADPFGVLEQLRSKLRLNAAAIQLPIGLEDALEGVVDLVEMRAVYFDGPNGEELRVEAVPPELEAEAKERRAELVATLADVDDDIAELFLMEEEPTPQQLHDAIRTQVIALTFVPVLMGSALKNTGVQPMLDAAVQYLPSPADRPYHALDLKADEAVVPISPDDPSAPFVGLGFKVDKSQFGQLTYLRTYQGSLKRGDFIMNATAGGKKIKVPRLVRMHSDEMVDVTEVGPGDICALFGLECSSGDTFTDGSQSLVMESMFVPEPVISLAIKPTNSKVLRPQHAAAAAARGPDAPARTWMPSARRSAASSSRIPPSGSRWTMSRRRRSSRAWASCIWRCTGSGSCGNTGWPPRRASPRWRSARRSPPTRRSTLCTRSRAGALGSTAG